MTCKINGIVKLFGTWTSVQKRRKNGILRIFSPLLYQLSYPAESTILPSQNAIFAFKYFPPLDFGLLFRPTFVAMKRKRTTKSVEEPVRRPDSYQQVFNERGERVRGLWTRGGRFYAQLDATDGKPYRYHLEHAETVPQAVLARQALKLNKLPVNCLRHPRWRAWQR
jgi:hypothetical protein